ncbi:MAG: oligosaccharide flippase family protein [Anaerolineae bacterium]|nr:oligosaccharide flippase family protein [Anaerolineae bacterium]
MKSFRLSGVEGTAIANLVSFGFNMVTSVIAARLLGPQGRGELAAMQNLAMFTLTFGTFGIPTAAAYYAGKDPKRANITFSTAQIMLLLLAFPVYILMYALAPELLSSQDTYVIQGARIFLLRVFIHFAGGLPYFMLRGLGRMAVWNGIRVQFSVLWLMVFVIGFFSGQISSLFVAYGYLVAILIHNITWMIAMFLTVRGSYKPDLSLTPSLFRYGLPSMLSSVPRELNLRIDQLLMAAFLPSETLGYYVVAVAWGSLLSPVMNAFAQTAFPHLAALHHEQAQSDLLQKILRRSVLVGSLLISVFVVGAPVVIPAVYGNAFKASIAAAMVLVVAGFISNLNDILEESFRGLGKPKWPMVAQITGLISTILLLFLLLPRYGLLGAALASIASYTFVFFVFVVLLKRETGLSFAVAFVPTSKDVRELYQYLVGRFPKRLSRPIPKSRE